MGLFEIIRTANHNLFRNKMRTFLTILAIFIGSFTIILNAAINAGVNSFIDEQIESLGGDSYILITREGTTGEMMSSMMNSSEPVEYNPNRTVQAFTEQQIEELKSLDGIIADSLQPNENPSVAYITSNYTDKKYLITAGTMPPGEFTVATTVGEVPSSNTQKYEIALQAGYPQALGFKSDEDAIGKTIILGVQDPVTSEIKTFEATVVGVQAQGMVAVNGAFISGGLSDAITEENNKYYPEEQKNQVYAFQAQFDNKKYTEAEIKQELKAHGFEGTTVSDMVGMIRTFFDVIMIVFMIFGGIALLAAAIGIINTLLMSVEERTREIGLDKALGMSSGKIFLNFSVEAIALGFWGSALGVAVAMAIGYVVNNLVHEPGAFLEAFPTFSLFEFTPYNIIPIILVIMLIAFLAGTAPAWKAAHKNPIDALRYE